MGTKQEHFRCFNYQWSWEDEKTNQGSQCIIRIYGFNERNESVYVRVEDFQIPLYIELPEFITWTTSAITALCVRLQSLNRNPIFQPSTLCFEERQRSYYASVEKLPVPTKEGIKYIPKKFPYLMALFSSFEAADKFAQTLRREVTVTGMGSLKLKCHAGEKNITPVLKLIAIRQLPSAGWMQGKGFRLEEAEKETTRKHEYAVSFHDLSALPEEQAIKMPIIYPKVMSFDNEANSTIISSMPKPERPGDKTFQISYTMLDPPINGQPKRYRKHLLCLGSYDPIDGVEVTVCRTEADLMVEFTKRIREEDPEVIIGYNILGWDIQYMIERAERICYCLGEFDLMGCIPGKHAKEDEVSWSSSAYGKQKMRFLDAEGRLFIDMLPYIKRNYKLPNYRLETVLEELGPKGVSKDPVKPKEIFRAWRKWLKAKDEPRLEPEARAELTRVGKYCVQDSYSTLLLYEKLLTWFDFTESAATNHVPAFYMISKGQQIKMYAQSYDFAFHNGIVLESNAYTAGENEHYTGAYVSEPIKGLYNNIVPFDFCLTGDTLLTIADGKTKRLDQITGEERVLGYANGGLGFYPLIGGLQVKGPRETIKLWLEDGTTIVSTPEHKFMIASGEWIQAKDLKDKYVKAYEVLRIDKTMPCLRKRVVDIRPNGKKPVFDIEVQTAHCFLANGLVAHNCSLYPSIIRGYNIDYTKLVRDEGIPDEDCHVMEWAEHHYCGCPLDEFPGQKAPKNKEGVTKKVCAAFKYRWLKHEVSGKGIVPTLLEGLLDARKKTRKIIAMYEGEIKCLKKLLAHEALTPENQEAWDARIKQYMEKQEDVPALALVRKNYTGKDNSLRIEADIKAEDQAIIKERIEALESLNIVLDRRQNAYKVNANSMYGAMGVNKGMLPFLPGAMCVTYMGRTNILKVNKFIERKCGGRVIYNDTDSAYCHFENFKDLPIGELWAHALKIVQDVRTLFPKELELAFEEKVYRKFLILTKKRYVAQAVNEEGKIDSKLLKRGIVLQRRDNCKALRIIYEQLVMDIFAHHEELIQLKERHKKNVEELDDIEARLQDTIRDLGGLAGVEEIKLKQKQKATLIERMQKARASNRVKREAELNEEINSLVLEIKKLNKLNRPILDLMEKKEQKQAISRQEILRTPLVAKMLTDITFSIDSVFNWKYGFKDYVITKQMTREVSGYKETRLPSHVHLAKKMQARGVPIGAGSRIEYVITKTGSYRKSDTQKEKIIDIDYFAEFREVLRLGTIDYLKYFINPIDELCLIVLHVENFVKQQFEQRIKYGKVTQRIEELSRPRLIFEKPKEGWVIPKIELED